jgi:hypothetical protein
MPTDPLSPTACYAPKDQELRGARANRAFDPVEARCASGSMVRFFLFHKKFAQGANFL